MYEDLTAIEVAEVAKQFFGDLQNARDWSDLDVVCFGVFMELHEMTWSGTCNPHYIATCLDVVQTLYLTLRCTNDEWPPPKLHISEAQRRQIADFKDLIDERLEEWGVELAK